MQLSINIAIPPQQFRNARIVTRDDRSIRRHWNDRSRPFLLTERLPEGYRQVIERVHAPLASLIAARAAQSRGKCLTVGLCGTQASGKSTMVAVLKQLLARDGLAAAILSIDDLYLPRDARNALAKQVHPLLQTRGVPGTHDVPLGTRVFAALRKPGVVALPSFEKASDDRRPPEQWPRVEGPMQVILFEGWCVGARAQSTEALEAPINALERDEDADGSWRRHANAALAGEYRRFFAEIDLQILLQAPSFEVVHRWRVEQEEKLRQRIAKEGGDASRLMSDAQVARFISHYERLTRHIIEEMPARADVVIRLDADREMTVPVVIRETQGRTPT